MKNAPSFAEINNLFTNGDPKEVWLKASGIIKLINRAYDFTVAQTSFNDVVRLFYGEYPGYCPIKTLFHNLHHTMDVFLCAVRLMHGVHISGTRLTDKELTMIMIDRKSTRLNSSHSSILYAINFFNATTPTEIYTLSLHDALPICSCVRFG